MVPRIFRARGNFGNLLHEATEAKRLREWGGNGVIFFALKITSSLVIPAERSEGKGTQVVSISTNPIRHCPACPGNPFFRFLKKEIGSPA
jgi:hypothetical protein